MQMFYRRHLSLPNYIQLPRETRVSATKLCCLAQKHLDSSRRKRAPPSLQLDTANRGFTEENSAHGTLVHLSHTLSQTFLRLCFCADNHLESTGGISHWQAWKHHLITHAESYIHTLGLRAARWVPRDAGFY